MGVDVIGIGPINEDGVVFYTNWSAWRPLANYASAIAPDITRLCKNWHTNDGDGLDAISSVALGDRLQSEIDAGRTLLHEKQRISELEALPAVSCNLCAGAGWLKIKNLPLICPVCDGKRYTRKSEYHFEVQIVQRFARFLHGSGGFEIW